MDRINLQEAFHAMELLEEEDFRLDDTDIKGILNFNSNDELNDIVDVFDPEANAEDDLQDTYIGNVILECEVCHSPIFKSIEEVVVDEESDLANIEDECPICHSNDGFKIIGQVAPYKEDSEIKVDVEDKEVNDFEDIDDSDDVEDVEEVEEESKVKDESLNEELDPELESRLDEIEDKLDSIEEVVCDGECDDDSLDVDEVETDTLDVEEEDGDIDVEDDVDESLNEGNGVTKEKLGSFSSDKEKEKFIKEKISTLKDFGYFDVKKNRDESKEEYKKRKENTQNSRIKEVEDSLKALDSEVSIENRVETLLKKLLGESMSKDSVREGFEKVDLEMEDKIIHVSEEEKPESPDDEMIVPVSDGVESEIMSDVGNDEPSENQDDIDSNIEDSFDDVNLDDDVVMGDEGSDKPSFDESLTNASNKDKVNESMIDYEVGDFSEKEFDNLGESYLKNVYDNINTFKTTSVLQEDEKLIVEGVIKFNSGKEKSTKFIFEAKDATKNGKVRFIGENAQITRGKKAFTLSGNMVGDRFIAESLNYNYHVASNRVYGTVKING